MSEKGNGDDSTEEGTGTGTGIGIDGTAPGGGGSAADQTGPHQGDTVTRGGPTPAAEWQGPPQAPEWQGPPQAPEWQGPAQAAEWQGPPQETGEPTETPEQKTQREAAEKEALRKSYDHAMERRAEAEAKRQGQTEILPPDMSEPGGQAEEGPESINKWNDNKPVIT